MSYRTELTEEILDSPEAKKILTYVSPIYGNAEAALHIFQAIGKVLDEADEFPEKFREQVTPVTASWTLDYWENQYGITPNKNLTVGERQKNLITKIRYRAPMNAEKIAEMVTSILGADSYVEENVAPNKFRVVVYNTDLNIDLEPARRCLDRTKPAQLNYDIILEQPFAATGYYGVRMQEADITTIRQVI